jgi:hypothetical protein
LHNGAGALALLLWQRGAVEVGTIAMVLPLTLQLTNMSRQIAMQITEIFEDIGVVQEGMITIAQPLRLIDSAGAQPLVVREGRIAFEDVRFGYGRETGVLEGFSLAVRPGEKIGLVGRSGAGKSTVVNLLLRFFDLEGARILIDGKDIAGVTQETSARQSARISRRLPRRVPRPAPPCALQRAGHADRRGPDPRKRDTVLAAVKAWPGSAGACSVVGGMAPLKMPRTDEHRGRFQEGWRGGPGRPKGVPDRSRADLSQLINPSPPVDSLEVQVPYPA